MYRSRVVLASVVLIGVLLLAGLGAIQVAEASGGSGSAPHTPGLVSPKTPGMSGTQVVIKGYMYHPMMLRVPPGTTVTWTNEDNVAHTVTFRNGIAGSGLLREGQTFQYTFRSAGTYAYYCSVHPYMRGTVVVTP